MKTYTGEFKSYTIDELSEKAKDRAYEKWDSSYYDGSDLVDTLNEFCRLFDVNCYDWQYDSCNYSYRFRINNNDIEELFGVRLATYIWNNYADYITKGKYYSKTKIIDGKYAIKSRRSKVLTSMEDCPLTGYCFDCDILDPIIDCLKYKRMFENYEELIRECLEGYFIACQKDIEYYGSMEYFVEEAQINEYEYDVVGNAFYLPREFAEIS